MIEDTGLIPEKRMGERILPIDNQKETGYATDFATMNPERLHENDPQSKKNPQPLRK